MKTRRHFAITDIIVNHNVSTQEELCELLRERGYEVTQATVSRDIKELKLVKVPDQEGYHYALPDSGGSRVSPDRMRRNFRDAVISINCSENLIVIRTLPGTANAVASTIDGVENGDILGTIAGDDTILVIARDRERAQIVSHYLGELIK
ncbi:MAG: arginine repressor [Methanomassiliicoccales archaeon]